MKNVCFVSEVAFGETLDRLRKSAASHSLTPAPTPPPPPPTIRPTCVDTGCDPIDIPEADPMDLPLQEEDSLWPECCVLSSTEPLQAFDVMAAFAARRKKKTTSVNEEMEVDHTAPTLPPLDHDSLFLQSNIKAEESPRVGRKPPPKGRASSSAATSSTPATPAASSSSRVSSSTVADFETVGRQPVLDSKRDDPNTCQVCARSFSNPVSSVLREHAATHLDPKLTKRFICMGRGGVACGFQSQLMAEKLAHEIACRSKIIDRARSDLTLVVECRRVFADCFPKNRLPFEDVLTLLTTPTPSSFTSRKRARESAGSDGAPELRRLMSALEESVASGGGGATSTTVPQATKDDEERRTCKICRLAIQSSYPRDLHSHSLVHVENAGPKRFRCDECGFGVHRESLMKKHLKKSKRCLTYKDAMETDTEFQSAMLSVFKKCFPRSTLPAFLGRGEEGEEGEAMDTTADTTVPVEAEGEVDEKEQRTCKVCGVEMKRPVHPRNQQLHSTIHLPEGARKRFHCQCGYDTHRPGSMNKHETRCGKKVDDRIEEKEVFSSLLEVFLQCFPHTPLPTCLQEKREDISLEEQCTCQKCGFRSSSLQPRGLQQHSVSHLPYDVKKRFRCECGFQTHSIRGAVKHEGGVCLGEGKCADRIDDDEVSSPLVSMYRECFPHAPLPSYLQGKKGEEVARGVQPSIERRPVVRRDSQVAGCMELNKPDVIKEREEEKEEEIVCQVCSKVQNITYPIHLQLHSLVHLGEKAKKRFLCQCGFESHRTDSLRKHAGKCRRPYEDRIGDDEVASAARKVFATCFPNSPMPDYLIGEGEVEKEKERTAPEKPAEEKKSAPSAPVDEATSNVKCELCGYVADRPLLRTFQIHSIVHLPDSAPKRFLCNCGFESHRQSSLVRHRQHCNDDAVDRIEGNKTMRSCLREVYVQCYPNSEIPLILQEEEEKRREEEGGDVEEPEQECLEELDEPPEQVEQTVTGREDLAPCKARRQRVESVDSGEEDKSGKDKEEQELLEELEPVAQREVEEVVPCRVCGHRAARGIASVLQRHAVTHLTARAPKRFRCECGFQTHNQPSSASHASNCRRGTHDFLHRNGKVRACLRRVFVECYPGIGVPVSIQYRKGETRGEEVEGWSEYFDNTPSLREKRRQKERLVYAELERGEGEVEKEKEDSDDEDYVPEPEEKEQEQDRNRPAASVRQAPAAADGSSHPCAVCGKKAIRADPDDYYMHSIVHLPASAPQRFRCSCGFTTPVISWSTHRCAHQWLDRFHCDEGVRQALRSVYDRCYPLAPLPSLLTNVQGRSVVGEKNARVMVALKYTDKDMLHPSPAARKRVFEGNGEVAVQAKRVAAGIEAIEEDRARTCEVCSSTLRRECSSPAHLLLHATTHLGEDVPQRFECTRCQWKGHGPSRQHDTMCDAMSVVDRSREQPSILSHSLNMCKRCFPHATFGNKQADVEELVEIDDPRDDGGEVVTVDEEMEGGEEDETTPYTLPPRPSAPVEVVTLDDDEEEGRKEAGSSIQGAEGEKQVKKDELGQSGIGIKLPVNWSKEKERERSLCQEPSTSQFHPEERLEELLEEIDDSTGQGVGGEEEKEPGGVQLEQIEHADTMFCRQGEKGEKDQSGSSGAASEAGPSLEPATIGSNVCRKCGEYQFHPTRHMMMHYDGPPRFRCTHCKFTTRSLVSRYSHQKQCIGEVRDQVLFDDQMMEAILRLFRDCFPLLPTPSVLSS